MKVVFVSNYMVIHQKPFCDAMIKLVGVDNFKFIACEELEAYRKTSGYLDMNDDPCVIKAYKSEDEKQRAREFATEADVAIVTINYSEWLRLRSKREGGLNFVYIERLLKIGLWYRFFPYPKYKQAWENCLKWRHDERFHMLCASAFGSSDLQLFRPGFPLERCWKWGYFPAVDLAVEDNAIETAAGSVSIVWVARLIRLKRPWMALEMARRLKADGYSFHLSIIGGGKLEDQVKAYVARNNLQDCVEVTGAVPNDQVRAAMRAADILLFTSNRREGWGAVLNEGMCDGCIPVAASMIGSVPFLIEDGVNGYVFNDGSVDSLVGKIESLIDQRENFPAMKTAARKTVVDVWNARVAAENFLALSEALLSGGSGCVVAEGPASPAEVMPDSWYNNKKR